MVDPIVLADVAALVPAGDATDLTLPAAIAGAGIGVIVVALFARRRGREDGRGHASKRKGERSE
ncbi:hypothetical protein EII22_03710 [Coriobacteriales bacterium OH1046]|nr:hypothetical protein EII22_03710 [Coriobacteriales bacterium OH1046]